MSKITDNKAFLLINSLSIGGAERQFSLLNKYLDFKKIFILEDNIKYDVELNKIIKLSFFRKKSHSFLEILLIPFYAFKLKKFIKNDQVLISILERSNFINIFLKLFTGHKAIICEVTNPSIAYRGFSGFIMKCIIKVLYKKADLIICESLGVKDCLVKNFCVKKENIKIINTILPIEEIEEKSVEEISEYKNIFKYPVLINVGRLSPPKAQWHILRTFSELKKQSSDLKLIFLGDGELKTKLVDLSNNLKLKTFSIWDNCELNDEYDVYFLGFQKNPYKFMFNSKLFVFSSVWESFPNGILEALVCGIPVVSSDCRFGPREILSPDSDFQFTTDIPDFSEYGILMPVPGRNLKNSENSLDIIEKIWIDTIGSVLKNEDIRKRYINNSRKRIFEFGINKIIPIWHEVINEFKK